MKFQIGVHLGELAQQLSAPYVQCRIARTTRDDGINLLAVYVQAMLRRVGVQIDLQVLDEGLMWKRLDAGDFEAAFMWQQWGPDEARKRYLGRDNPTGYRNPEAIQLIDQAVATGDPDELDRIYGALAEILRADLPLTRLVPATVTTFVHRRVRGLSTPFRAKPDQYMEDLWLEGGNQQ